MRRRSSWLLSFLWALAPLLAQHAASAQTGTPSSADEAEAQRLATEAWHLVESKRPAEACVLYREALALKSSPGLLNNVGRCFEQEGDAVRAIETFESAVELAKQQEPSPKRQAWLQFARQEIDTLEPQLSKLVFRLPRIAGLSVSLDGKPVSPDREYAYVQPGVHHLEVKAPGRVTHSAELIPRAGERMQVEVPALAAAAAPPAGSLSNGAAASAAQGKQEKQPAHDGPSRVLPWTLVGAGTAVVAAGAITGLIAASKEKELEDNCPNSSCPSEPGWQDKIDSTQTTAIVADVLWGVGLATLGVGVTLLILDDGGESDEPSQLEAGCFGAGCGLLARGRF